MRAIYLMAVFTALSAAAACWAEESGVSAGSMSKGQQLMFVIIKAESSLALKQLHDMKLHITRVKPDPARPPDEDSLSGGFIVEAVVTPAMVTRLRAKKFVVCERSPAMRGEADAP